MLKLSVIKEDINSTFVDLLDLQSGVRQSLAFSLVLIISVYIWEKWKSQTKTTSKIQTINNIPSFRHFPFWMPSAIELFYEFYLIRKEGLRITYDWWSSMNHAPVCSIKAPIEPVVITDPNLIKQILGSSLAQFLHKPKLFYDVVLSDILKDGLFGSHPNIWKPHRKTLNQYFTHRTLPSHLKTINKYGKAIIQKLDSFSEAQIKVDQFYPILHDKILMVILDILFGEKILDKMGTRELSGKFREWQTLVVYRYLNIQNMIPFIWRLNPKRMEYLNTISYLNSYVKEAISKSKMALEEKQVCVSDKSERYSCVEHMLLSELGEKEIMDEVFTIIFGGHETTFTTLYFILQHLAEHPIIQRKCQAEIDLIFGCEDEKLSVKMADLTQLKYLEQCILETLRLTPAVPAIARELNQQIRLENYIFEKGAVLLFSPWIIHRNPEIYHEPEKFDPDRFLPENVKARHPYAFIPFSMGPRNCIGWKLAMMELKTIISFILRNYDISTSDKLKNVKLFFDITLSPERNFNLALHKRKLLRKRFLGIFD